MISRVLLDLSRLKRENNPYLKLVLTVNLFLLRRISLDYFHYHQVFVYTRGNGNLFVMNSSRLMFSYRLVAVLRNTIH